MCDEKCVLLYSLMVSSKETPFGLCAEILGLLVSLSMPCVLILVCVKVPSSRVHDGL
jgi:hypothetical protein